MAFEGEGRRKLRRLAGNRGQCGIGQPMRKAEAHLEPARERDKRWMVRMRTDHRLAVDSFRPKASPAFQHRGIAQSSNERARTIQHIVTIRADCLRVAEIIFARATAPLVDLVMTLELTTRSKQ